MSITVVIPTCRRPAMLAHCLRTIPTGTDVVVSDDGGDEETRSLMAREFPHIRFVAGPRHGPAANRNNGARAAEGDWLAFIDDDCEAQPGWLEAIVKASPEADVVEGRTVAPGATDSPLEEHVENLRGGVLWSCNLAVERKAFLALGSFDEDFLEAGGEDMEFAWRVARAGLRVKFVPEALVHHPPRYIGWRGLWRRMWMARWMPLYWMKTGQSAPLPITAVRELTNLCRSTVHLVTRPEPGRWRRRIFAIAWRWITFPIVLPWMLRWQVHFEEMLRLRQAQSPSKEEATVNNLTIPR